MTVTVSIAKSSLAADDPVKAYVWMTWSRIAGALKEEFAPCLPVVLESLMAGVSGVEQLSGPQDAANPVSVRDVVATAVFAVVAGRVRPEMCLNIAPAASSLFFSALWWPHASPAVLTKCLILFFGISKPQRAADSDADDDDISEDSDIGEVSDDEGRVIKVSTSILQVCWSRAFTTCSVRMRSRCPR